MPIGTFTAVLHKEGDLHVADCPEVGTVSQGKTVEEAIANLKEATELYMEEFPPDGSSRPGDRIRGALCLGCPAFPGQKRSALLNVWASVRFGNVAVTRRRLQFRLRLVDRRCPDREPGKDQSRVRLLSPRTGEPLSGRGR